MIHLLDLEIIFGFGFAAGFFRLLVCARGERGF
jgi:hypothetical protein